MVIKKCARQILLGLMLFSGLCLHNYSSAQDLQFMTYNIRYDNPADGENQWSQRRSAVVELIRDYAPQVLGIQEGLHRQVVFLDSSLVDYTYVGVGRDDGKQKGEYSAIYFDTTRVQCLESGTFWLSETPEQISVGWDAALERVCTWGRFLDKQSSREYYVFNTHFDHKGSVARQESAKLIIHKIKELNPASLPVVLMGDFNAQPAEAPIQVLVTYVQDALPVAPQKPIDPAGTFNGFDPASPMERRIDYIFTRGVETIAYEHIDRRRADELHVSDHLPVYLKARIPD